MTTPLDRVAEALESRYTIEGELGGGGMATVYLAEDTKHHRRVADVDIGNNDFAITRAMIACAVGPVKGGSPASIS